MATITAIVASRRRQGRFDVEVDGSAIGAVSLDVIDRLRLAIGRVVDDMLVARLTEAVAELGTYDRALAMLAAQARSAVDLRRRLIRKGEAVERVDAAIERLRAAGYLDDEAFARQFARAKAVRGGAGKRRLQQELARRGVDRTVADGAIAEVLVDEGLDEAIGAQRAAEKKLRSLVSEDGATQRRRLYAYLARRGYDNDVIRRVLDRVLAPSSLGGDSEDVVADDL